MVHLLFECGGRTFSMASGDGSDPSQQDHKRGVEKDYMYHKIISK